MGARIVAFRGVRTDAEPHLIAAGGKDIDAEFADMVNLRTETGAARSRPGFELVRRYAGAAVPVILFCMEKIGPAPAEFARDRAENGGVMKEIAATAAPELIPPGGN